MTCVLRGSMIGSPQIVGGCAEANTAACLIPLQTIYAMTVTSTGRVVAVATTLGNNNGTNVSSPIPNLSFEFTPTSEGYYSITYAPPTAQQASSRISVGLDSTTGTLVLMAPNAASTYSVEIRYATLNNTQYMQVRVKGNYTYTLTQGLVPIFQPSTSATSHEFALASQLGRIGDANVIVPSIVSEDVYASATLPLPPPYVLTNWSVIGVASGQLITYPLSPVCSDNTNPAPLATAVNMSIWLWLIAAIILVAIAIALAFVFRRVEYVHDPRLPAAIATVTSMRQKKL